MSNWSNVFDVTTESEHLTASAWAVRPEALHPAGICIYLVDDETNRDYEIMLSLTDVLGMVRRSVALIEEELATPEARAANDLPTVRS